jgi:hypothetical protein
MFPGLDIGKERIFSAKTAEMEALRCKPIWKLKERELISIEYLLYARCYAKHFVFII